MNDSFLRNSTNKELVNAVEFSDDPVVKELCARLVNYQGETAEFPSDMFEPDEIRSLEDQVSSLEETNSEVDTAIEEAITKLGDAIQHKAASDEVVEIINEAVGTLEQVAA